MVVELLLEEPTMSEVKSSGFEHFKRQVSPGGGGAAAAALSTEGVTLHYVMGGQGPLMVLLHGWPETWYAWRRVLPALAEHFTVLAPDLRGLGDSSKPLSGYDTNTVSADIRELVLALGHDEVNLVGHDWGASVAYAYAAQYRESVRKLCVIEMPVPGFGWDALLTPGPQGWLWHMHFHAIPEIPEWLTQGREREYISHFLRGFGVVDPFAVEEATIDEYVRCYTGPGAWRSGLQYYKAWWTDIEQNLAHAQHKLEMPVLALGGEHAAGAFVGSAYEQVASDVTTDVIPNCGHWVAEEKPAELIPRLLTFFDAGAKGPKEASAVTNLAHS
jgi:pimeloyl-ACP methyl ester carboxylesterase